MTCIIPQVDVFIICALEEESDAVEHVICEWCQVTFVTSVTRDGLFAYRSTTIANIKGEPLTLALFCLAHPGPVSATRDVGTLLEKFQPRFVGMSGVCAGDKRHLHLGDLVVAEYAYHFEEGKATRDEVGVLVHQPDGITYGPAEHILRYVRVFGAWKTPVAALKKRLFHTDEPLRCVSALMASGMAVRSDDPFEVLQRQHRKTWALDMEAAAFYHALRATPFVDGLVVKGVCDYADLSKDDTFHEFAAHASAVYLLTFIREYVTMDTFGREYRSPFSVFTVPYQRNPFFTGCDELLAQIHTHFQTRQATALALSGLGGVGKTQIALEYAHRYQQDYQVVLWTRADTYEVLVSGYVAFADELKLQPQDEQDPTKVIKAVKAWLATRRKWLLILDNSSDLSWLHEFLPTRFDGHILLTTQAHAIGGLARRIDVDTMPQNVGTLFLLRRASLITPEANFAEAACADMAKAQEICEELGGLPLALDQAGAYVEEMQCSLSDYLECYKMRRECLLKRRGGLVTEHSLSVVAIFSFAFKQVQQKNAAAVELLKFASYLALEPIPLELISQGKVSLGVILEPVVTDAFQLDQALEALQAYSLIQRDGKNRTFSIHRLVQAVLQEWMTPCERIQWNERAIQFLSMNSCDNCRKETRMHAEKQLAPYIDPITVKEITIPVYTPSVLP